MTGERDRKSYAEIFGYLYRTHAGFVSRKKTQPQIAKILDSNGSERKIRTAATISKAFRNAGNVTWIEDALRHPAIREKLEVEFDLPGIFSKASFEYIDSLIKGKRNQLEQKNALVFNRPSAFIRKVDPATFLSISLLKNEKEATAILACELLEFCAPIIHWAAEPWSGASLFAYELMQDAAFQRHYRLIIMLRASNADYPYEDEIEELARDFGISATADALPRRLAEELKKRKALLVVCDACNLPAGSHASDKSILRLFSAVASDYEDGEPACVLTIGRSKTMDERVKQSRKSSELLGLSLKLSNNIHLESNNTKKVFLRYFEHYRKLRGHNRIEVGGSRVKRAWWHYETVKGRKVWPANVRLRAFFASHLNNYSYFDPTSGFDELCGPGIELPLDIQLIAEDICAYLARKALEKRKDELRALRFCSTAKHWLTLDALNLLGSAKGPLEERDSDVIIISMAERTFENQFGPESPMVRHAQKPAGDESTENVYALGIGIKALVQDQWRIEDPAGRALAHWRIAHRLWGSQNDKGLLRREFPYREHYGRSRIFFLGNTITHLMRTIESAEINSDRSRGSAGFPDPPMLENNGCSPAQVLEFCFSRIFQQELNGNRNRKEAFWEASRSLSRRHGVFQYSAELLQLMSRRHEIGEPHPALPKHLHVEFIRECGLSLLDLGELDKAESCFNRILERYETSEEVKIDQYLNLATVLTEKMLLDEAESAIAEAKHLIDSCEGSDKTIFDVIGNRLLAVRAHLKYVRGNHQESFDIVRSHQDASEGRFSDPDLLHLEVALISIVEQDPAKALFISARAAFRSATEGRLHEAIGFRVATAHAYRKMGRSELSEKILDDVLDDILNYGCSERTLLNVCLEAGRVMIDRDKPIRSYASYLRPCALRATERGFRRYAVAAARYAIEALTQVKKRQAEKDEDEWLLEVYTAMDEETAHQKKDLPRAEDIYEVDPLFGYLLEESSDVIKRLSFSNKIEEEIQKMREISCVFDRDGGSFQTG